MPYILVHKDRVWGLGNPPPHPSPRSKEALPPPRLHFYRACCGRLKNDLEW